ncbi:hypothetical protein ACOSQ3_009268 [Xanthoceras sorbifolium]
MPHNYSIADITALLLTHEAQMEQDTQEGTLSANMAVNKKSTGPGNSQGIFGNKTPTSNSGQTGNRGENQQSGNRKGRGRGRNYSNNSRPPCQICHRVGHGAYRCYYRYDQTFQQPQPQFNGQNSAGFSTGNKGPMQAMIATPNTVADSSWYPDSGATNHCTPDVNNLQTKADYHGNERIYMGNGNALTIASIGDNSFDSNNHIFRLRNILHIPQITKNLLSVSKFVRENAVFIEFHPHFCLVKDRVTKKVLLQGVLKQGLYVFDLPSLQSHASQSSITNTTSVFHSKKCCNSAVSIPTAFSVNTAICSDSLWHKRLGHPTSSIVHSVLNKCNIPFSKSTTLLCDACQVSKSHKLPFSSSQTTYTQPLQLIVADVWGPAPILSSNGFKYYVSFLDAYSRYTWVYLLKAKSEVYHVFLKFKTQVELQFSHKILTLQSDCGKEFMVLSKVLDTFGILFRHSCPYVHEQNGLVERKHRHIVETGLSLLAHASMPLRFWDEAFLTATYLINRMPTPVLHGNSPYTSLFGVAPDYTSLRVFGCLVYPHLRPYNKHKLQFRSTACTFIGYSNQFKGYRCLSSTGRVYITRNVVFDEQYFPFAHSHSSTCLVSSQPAPLFPPRVSCRWQPSTTIGPVTAALSPTESLLPAVSQTSPAASQSSAAALSGS